VIGGAMANTFLLSNNYNVGSSLVENDLLHYQKRYKKKQNQKIAKYFYQLMLCAQKQ
jgi:3-phosphoglycerate kinase